jgi:hypothetical protein
MGITIISYVCAKGELVLGALGCAKWELKAVISCAKRESSL